MYWQTCKICVITVFITAYHDIDLVTTGCVEVARSFWFPFIRQNTCALWQWPFCLWNGNEYMYQRIIKKDIFRQFINISLGEEGQNCWCFLCFTSYRQYSSNITAVSTLSKKIKQEWMTYGITLTEIEGYMFDKMYKILLHIYVQKHTHERDWIVSTMHFIVLSWRQGTKRYNQ